ncbi:tautomerase family protein [Janthinobacterium sp. 17J80-10]|uniref:tautomerase family protein n=1 Tax=Janthinobacterium sp. 17J80-10 TaxID=2497863 RepID=UPI0010053983|nr:tautomerase family protein [Janthinobacterium sp. 17J80-10]QAU33007.1 4-oxalocrotonate tautomerase [Janthinobacterium sp. 17J80-10]
MPVINFHIVEDKYTQGQLECLLLESSKLYAEVLNAPMERVRAFVTLHKKSLFAVAGKMVSSGQADAPYFSFIVLEGRPLEERHRLLTGFTELVVDILGARRELVRGGCTPIHPENWCIGGAPASVVRKTEIRARDQSVS